MKYKYDIGDKVKIKNTGEEAEIIKKQKNYFNPLKGAFLPTKAYEVITESQMFSHSLWFGTFEYGMLRKKDLSSKFKESSIIHG